jgi:hypothetical protein
MILAPRFAWLHLHKSGGTFVNELLLRYVPGARRLGYHLPRSLLPPEAAGLPVLGTVRNPWSYYVSWYAFQRTRPTPNALYRVLSDGGALDFRATIARLATLGETPALLDAVVAALPATYTNQGLNLPGFALASIRGSGKGFYSWLHDYLYVATGSGRGDEPLHVGRMESLRADLRWLLELVGEPLTPDFDAALQAMPARNVTAHGPYAEYYDTTLAHLVGERDAAVAETYGYSFGD